MEMEIEDKKKWKEEKRIKWIQMDKEKKRPQSREQVEV
jgi:hypothetical protein